MKSTAFLCFQNMHAIRLLSIALMLMKQRSAFYLQDRPRLKIVMFYIHILYVCLCVILYFVLAAY